MQIKVRFHRELLDKTGSWFVTVPLNSCRGGDEVLSFNARKVPVSSSTPHLWGPSGTDPGNLQLKNGTLSGSYDESLQEIIWKVCNQKLLEHKRPVNFTRFSLQSEKN